MNKIWVLLVSSFLVILFCISSFYFYNSEINEVSSSLVNDEFYIIIDAGHGGMDGGTTSADGTLEKDINLEISNKLNSMMNAVGFKTIMLRKEDDLIGDNSLSTIRERKVSDIKTRLRTAESYPNSVFISIHQNHYSVSKYKGTQVFYSPNSADSKLLALSIQDSIVTFLQHDNKRQTKEVGTNIYLLYNIRLPSVMVECGFLSNPEEAELLKNEQYQKMMAFSIMNGIIKFLE